MDWKEFKKLYRQHLKDEKNVRIRERHESFMQRLMLLILGISLLISFFLVSVFFGIFSIALYFFFEFKYMQDFHNETDELIRKS